MTWNCRAQAARRGEKNSIRFARPGAFCAFALLSLVLAPSVRAEETVAGNQSLLLPAKLTTLETSPEALSRATDSAPTLTSNSRARLARRGGQIPGAGLLPNPLRVTLRLGAMVSPRLGFAGGVDLTVPKLSILPNWETRIDADVIIVGRPSPLSFNYTTFIPVTINQVYSKGVVSGTRFYFGAGVGPYFGKVTRLGGKVFVGADLTSRLSVEAGVHFSGTGDPLVTGQVRFPL